MSAQHPELPTKTSNSKAMSAIIRAASPSQRIGYRTEGYSLTVSICWLNGELISI